ncbi:MAG: bifunctional DNA-formamidopyrimidine glycosylase/DNA-(apurinic or apyrimidinic site) lyase [Acidimicrobiia bacterium]|nr:bifunctional DNA-formamidopyrimidine glycosylase/DNA-(apurinic or apyrimidinic site) lyase [Acidimicrobiia bacterium]
MPELPEVETVRRSLAPALEGATIVAVEVGHPRVVRRQPRPRDFHDRLLGRRVASVGRHGKFLMIDLEGDFTWVVHLGMSGRIRLETPGGERSPHTHVVVETDRHQEMHFVDPRTFGFMAVFTPDEFEGQSFAHLGPDALNDLPRFRRLLPRLEGRVIAIKSLLLDQYFVAGLGNIYADEVLHRSCIRPDRPAGTLSVDEVRILRGAIGPVLRAGLRWGGTSLNDLAYLLPDGRAGEYFQRLRVYGRVGEPCRRDGTAIERTVIGGRSSFWCPTCQR